MPRGTGAERTTRFRHDHPDLARLYPSDTPAGRLIDGITGNSPYLTWLMDRDPAALAGLLAVSPEDSLAGIIDGARSSCRSAETQNALMSVLRDAKNRAALLIALADLGGAWSLEQVTEALSDLADMSVSAALDWLLRDGLARGHLQGLDPDEPARESGLSVLAMGKLGARELNYSSDIDLVVFFDGERVPAATGQNAQAVCVAVVRKLVRILQDRTTDGYVFRVDLRLRPDAGATQAAVSLSAAEHYYEDLGQNWERAAFIKARPCAGDPETGARALAMVHPFVWRKHLDFSAIEDIHAIKRQIHAHGGHGQIAIEGHDLKLGKGGIREIEFFAQTQQLIAGGRHPDLRPARTVDALDALASLKIVEGGVAADLIDSYRFLRIVEHRLQMIADEQTHALPANADGMARIAAFAGYDLDVFRATVTSHLSRVAGHYASLFDQEPPLSERSGNLVFTGVDHDPETLRTLERMGFSDPTLVSETVRRWHYGRIRATRTARAREILTKLVPTLLEALAETHDPSGGVRRFDQFLAGLPAGVHVLSLFQARPAILNLLSEVLGTAPRMAGVLSRQPGLLDSLFDPRFTSTLPGPHRLARLHEQAIAGAEDFERILDGTRRFAQEQGLRIAVQVLRGRARAMAAGAAHSLLAETVIRGLIPAVTDNMRERHGGVPGGDVAVLAMGKLGSRELTASSDLDLILIYDHDGSFSASIGPVSLHGSQFFTRFCQRLINALTAPTAEGKFYDVDLRLRPSGRSGPIATRLSAFEVYHQKEAWTWEHMALTRARVVAGSPVLAAQVEASIRRILTLPRDPDHLRSEAAAMRERMAAQGRVEDPWAVKTVRGGLIDLEFIAQVLQLRCAAKCPDVLHQNTMTAFARLASAGCLRADQARRLIAASRLQQSVAQVLTLAIDGPVDGQSISRPLQGVLERSAGVAAFARLEENLLRTQSAVRSLFDELIGSGA